MLILLPPSEAKRAGGAARPLDLGALRFPALTLQRTRVIDALVALSTDAGSAARVLKLNPSQHGEIVANAAISSAPTLPAVDRYRGVLYEALDAASLDTAARRWLRSHVVVHSAPFGPIGALDRIPAYRLGAGVSLPGLLSPRRLWADAVTEALAGESPSFILDLRSEAYAALGPVPPAAASAYVRVVAQGADGVVRALNHFNKHAKGALVRRLAQSRPRIASRRAFARWADAAGIRLRENGAVEMELVA